MAPRAKESLREGLEQLAPEYGLDELVYLSFCRHTGAAPAQARRGWPQRG